MKHSISLGMPGLVEASTVLAPRRPIRQIVAEKVCVGSDFPVSVESMTTTQIADITATLQQIAEFRAAGRDSVRVASGDGKGQIFVEGKVIRVAPESGIVETLLLQSNWIAAEMTDDGVTSGASTVSES